MNDAGKLVYGIAADTDGLKRDLNKAKGMFSDLSNSTQAEGVKMQNMMAGLSASMGAAFSIAGAGLFIKQIVAVRSEFEQLEVAFTTMLKSKEKSDKLMQEITLFAAKTPFDLTQVATGTKQLLAYGFAAEDMTGNLSMLGNVASGVGSQIGDLIYLYGTLKASGRVTQMDMNQFAGRGIPIYEELAKVMKINTSEVRDFVSEGKVGFKEIEAAFKGMTGESGMFYNLMEKQSETLGGAIANLGDDFDSMLNELGKGMQAPIKSGVEFANSLINNYENIGKVIAILIATYGTYRAALITTAALERIVATSKTATLYLEMNRALGALTFGHKANAVAIGVQTAAQKMLNTVMAINPYVLAATAIIGIGTAMIMFRDKTTAAERAMADYNERLEKSKELEKERQDVVESSINTLSDQYATDKKRHEAMGSLIQLYPDLIKKYNLEKLSLEEILQLKKEIAEIDEKKAGEDLRSDYEKQKIISDKASSAVANFRGTGEVSDAIMFNRLAKTAATEKEKLKIFSKEVDIDNARNYIAGASGFSNEQLQAEIDARGRLLAKIGNKNIKGQITGQGTFSKDEITTQKALLEAEMKKRNAITTTANQDVMAANKELVRLKKELEGVLTSTMDPAERKKKVDELQESMKAQEKIIANYTKKAEKSNNDVEKQRDQVEKNKLQQQRANEDMAAAVEQARIDNMEKGTLKELDQQKLNHERRMVEIQRQQDDLLTTLQEFAQQEYEAKGGKGKVDKNKVTLTPEQTSNFQLLRDNEAESNTTKQKEINDKLAKDYQGYANRKIEIEKKFNADIAELSKTNGENSEPVKQAKLQLEKALKDLQSEAMRESGTGLVELYLFGDGSGFMQAKIKEILPLFEDITKLTIKELRKLKTDIGTIELTPEQIATMTAAGVEVEKLDEALKKVKDSSTEAIEAQEWEKIIGIANKLSGAIGQLGAALQETGGVLGEIGGVISGLSGGIDNLTTIFDKNATKTDIISAGVSGLTDLYAMVAGQIAKNKKAQEEWNAKIEQAAHLARMARIEAEEYKKANIFGVEDPYAKAIAGALEYSKAMEEMSAISNTMGNGQVQTGTKQVLDGGNIATGAGAGAAVGAAVGSFIPIIGNLIGAGIGALIGAAIGAASTKTVAVFTSLKDKYGEIFDSETFELNPQILQNYDKMDEATKKLIDNWEEIREKAVEAKEKMRETFAELAGDIGKSLSDSLVEAFTNGNVYGALDSFKEKVTEVIQNLIQQMIFAKYFQKIFSDLGEEMDKSFGANGDNDIVDDILRAYDKIPEGLEGYEKTMKEVQEGLKKQGIEIFEMSNRTAVNKGIATASQDSVNELNGRFTAIQSHTYSISENVKVLVLNMGSMIGHLFNIERNTSRLEKIESTMDSVKSGIDSINTKGINIKSW